MPTITTDKTYRIQRDNCQAVLIDVQEKLTPSIYRSPDIIDKTSILIKGLHILGVPILISEQYKKGLGDTVEPIRKVLDDLEEESTKPFKSIEKRAFSVYDDDEAWNHIAQQNRNAVILFGIETHVCVMQTALDLLDDGMQPIIIADATGSRSKYDRKQAIRRMRRAGAVISTTEAILFELCRTSTDPAFKAIVELVK